MTRVLVIEDERGLRRALDINLRAHGYEVSVAADGQSALRTAAHEPPDAVVLDLGLPDIDGVEVIEGLRGWSGAPIIVLSARSGEPDKVVALDAGADDYVTKPFGMDELLARLRAALRRTATAPEAPVIETETFTIDLATKEVSSAEAEVADAARRVSLQVSTAGRHVGQEAIQLHGGIAMTMEYSVGMVTAHLTALDHLLGDGGHHLRELAGAVTTYDALDPLD